MKIFLMLKKFESINIFSILIKTLFKNKINKLLKFIKPIILKQKDLKLLLNIILLKIKNRKTNNIYK